MVVKVFIRDRWGDMFEVNLCDTEEQFENITVRQLKRRIAERKDIREYCISLIFEDRHLEDDRRLSYYGVRHMATIDMDQREPTLSGSSQRYSSMDRLVDFQCRLQ